MEKDVVSGIWLKRQVLITQQSTCTHFPHHNHSYSLHSNKIVNTMYITLHSVYRLSYFWIIYHAIFVTVDIFSFIVCWRHFGELFLYLNSGNKKYNIVNLYQIIYCWFICNYLDYLKSPFCSTKSLLWKTPMYLWFHHDSFQIISKNQIVF